MPTRGCQMEWAVGQLYPVIPEKLFITTHVCRAQTQREIQKHSDLFFFSSREPESYMSFCKVHELAGAPHLPALALSASLRQLSGGCFRPQVSTAALGPWQDFGPVDLAGVMSFCKVRPHLSRPPLPPADRCARPLAVKSMQQQRVAAVASTPPR